MEHPNENDEKDDEEEEEEPPSSETTAATMTTATASLDPSDTSSSPTTILHQISEDEEICVNDDDLFLKAQAAADLAEEEGKLEESNLRAKRAEENAQRMAESVGSLLDGSTVGDNDNDNDTMAEEDSVDIFSVTSYDNSTLAEGTSIVSETTGRSSAREVVFVSDSKCNWRPLQQSLSLVDPWFVGSLVAVFIEK